MRRRSAPGAASSSEVLILRRDRRRWNRETAADVRKLLVSAEDELDGLPRDISGALAKEKSRLISASMPT